MSRSGKRARPGRGTLTFKEAVFAVHSYRFQTTGAVVRGCQLPVPSASALWGTAVVENWFILLSEERILIIELNLMRAATD